MKTTFLLLAGGQKVNVLQLTNNRVENIGGSHRRKFNAVACTENVLKESKKIMSG